MPIDADKPSWGWRDVIIVYLGIMLLGILFGMYGETLFIALSKTGLAYNRFTYFSLGFLLQFSVTVGLVLLLSRIYHRAGWREMGFSLPSGQQLLKYGVLGGLLLVVAVVLLGLPVQILNPELPPQTYEEMLRTSQDGSRFLMLMVMGVILAPLAEEIYYRGMLYPLLRKSVGPLWGAILAGLIFGAVHWDMWRTIPLAVGGILLCRLYEKTGSIWVTTVAHGIWNAVMTAMVYLSMRYI